MKAIWFGQHLYQPLLHMQDKIVEIKPRPAEPRRANLCRRPEGLPRQTTAATSRQGTLPAAKPEQGKGVGFFEAGNFHPDFILWLLVGNTQHIIFVDPKGIRQVGVTDPKVQFYNTIKEIEKPPWRSGHPPAFVPRLRHAVTLHAAALGVSKQQMQSWHIVIPGRRQGNVCAGYP